MEENNKNFQSPVKTKSQNFGTTNSQINLNPPDQTPVRQAAKDEALVKISQQTKAKREVFGDPACKQRLDFPPNNDPGPGGPGGPGNNAALIASIGNPTLKAAKAALQKKNSQVLNSRSSSNYQYFQLVKPEPLYVEKSGFKSAQNFSSIFVIVGLVGLSIGSLVFVVKKFFNNNNTNKNNK